ncbi:MAG: nicotinamide riboside transporter PnuC [Bacteroidales bacterium]|nr:nicotinamide riboside transporter PnuC [Bacteroidales bacterium]
MENVIDWLYANSSWIQIVSLVCGVTYMLLQIFQHKWMWYFSIAASTAALIVASSNLENGSWAPLWAQVGLNIYLIVIAFVGIFRWRTLDAESGGKIHIVRLSKKRLALVFCIIAAGTPLLAWLLGKTSDPAPLLDGASLVLSLVAAWLLSQSHIEQYLFWIAANILIVAVWATQSKWAMVIMYSCYIVACAIGFFNWKKNGVIVE